MKRLNNAFTLTELLVALGVVAVLTAILMPIIINMMPNQNTLMAKRAYYTVQTLVADLINDEACYPDKTTSATDSHIGFDDPKGSPNCDGWGEDHIDDSTMAQAATKFQTLFTKKLGKDPSDGFFKTDDGMAWQFVKDDVFKSYDPESSDDEEKIGGYIRLVVDVNGLKSDPNCSGDSATYTIGSDDTASNDACKDRKNGYDRFGMKIYGDGKVEILDDWAKNAVQVDRNITSDKNSNDEDE